MNDLFCIGKFVKPHGLKGFIKLVLYNRNSDSLKTSNNQIWLKESDNSFKDYYIEAIKSISKNPLLKLKGCEDIDQAELFRNKEVFIKRENLSGCEEDEYYIRDLIGCLVKDENKKKIGIITEITSGKEVDIFEIKDSSKQSKFLLFKKINIIKINLNDKFIIVKADSILDCA
ncbi:MAG: ribosome maturation factor RimM [Pseudomonadota bacterium]